MSIWRLPAVRYAAEQIIGKMALVRRECPTLTPKRRLLEAKRRCPEGIVPATTAIELAEDKARNETRPNVWLEPHSGRAEAGL